MTMTPLVYSMIMPYFDSLGVFWNEIGEVLHILSQISMSFVYICLRDCRFTKKDMLPGVCLLELYYKHCLKIIKNIKAVTLTWEREMQSGTKKLNNFLDLTKEKKGAEKSWLMLCIYILLLAGNDNSSWKAVSECRPFY
jgi:hypothetical protein